MLTLWGRSQGRGALDVYSRRSFLRIGGMAAGGLSLGQLLACHGATEGADVDALGVKSLRSRQHKSIINIYLPGGPSHIDLFDLKPEAPVEIRGEFSPIRTNVPGMDVCELFPRLATMADRFAIIRSVVGSEGHHDCFQCMTGRTHRDTPPPGGWPMFGSVVSKVQGPRDATVPPNLSLMYPTSTRTWGDPGNAGFVGQAHNPMTLVAKDPLAKSQGMTLQGISLDRLEDRKQLLRSVDAWRQQVDHSSVLQGMDNYSQQALAILTSSRLADALDLSQEDPRILERYGVNDPAYQRDGAPRMVRNFLVARRLVEAGARVVSMNYSRWDWHGGDGMNFPSSRVEGPLLDVALSGLLTDLHERGLDQDVTVIVWGEFGRTPKINKMNSRDHWPQVSFALMAGGGMRTGQVIGATNRLGEFVTERPVSFQEIFATLYHNVGINIRTATIPDLSGRPQYLVDSGVEPIRELVGSSA